MLKILIVAQNLQMGGIQKSLINLVHELQQNEQYEIDIFTFCDGELSKDLPKNIQVRFGNKLLELISTPFHVIKKQGSVISIGLRIFLMMLVRFIGSTNLYKLLFKLEKNDQSYNVAISYFNDVPTGYFNKGTNLYVDQFVNAEKKFSWLHTDPIEAGFSAETCREVYEPFDKIVCVSYAVKEKFDRFLPEYAHKTSVIYNMFPIKEINHQSEKAVEIDSAIINLVSVGRMDNSTKNFDKIPYICRYLNEQGVSNFKWRVIGSGPDFETNNRLVDELNVAHLVEFVGHKTNPYPYIKNSDLFILTSYYEGFPMVVNESLILGVPVVTTNYAAAHEQIEDGKNGIISDNGVEGVQEILLHLLTKPAYVHEMKIYISNNRYSNNIAVSQLESEFYDETGRTVV